MMASSVSVNGSELQVVPRPRSRWSTASIGTERSLEGNNLDEAALMHLRSLILQNENPCPKLSAHRLSSVPSPNL